MICGHVARRRMRQFGCDRAGNHCGRDLMRHGRARDTPNPASLLNIVGNARNYRRWQIVIRVLGTRTIKRLINQARIRQAQVW